MPVARPSRALNAAVVIAMGVVCGGCPSRKLSSGGGAMDTLMYDVLGAERDTGYYYDVLLSAHDRSTFAYVQTEDPFIADKCVDAIVHLGRASYNRLEGEVQVILLLSDVVLEDWSSLAKASAAGALTALGTKLPTASGPEREENGLRYLDALKELDGMHDAQGRLRNDCPAQRQRAVQLVDEIGSYKFPNLQLTKDGLRFFPAKSWVTRATDPAMREALDRAMVRRSRAVILASLEGAVLDRNHNVRVDAVKGLKTLQYAGAQESVLDRLEVETNSWVRGEMAEYFGAIGGRRAAEALLRLLDDDDGGVRHRARRALTRIAGDDRGKEVAAWQTWVDRAFPPTVAVPATPAA
ncbi:MAG TPA: HEAT repeat domain-containing protein, partial [Planctomycetota bacterium]|nr:HEAT repeat domain-containing protein [Planctomycetota bacterium]